MRNQQKKETASSLTPLNQELKEIHNHLMKLTYLDSDEFKKGIDNWLQRIHPDHYTEPPEIKKLNTSYNNLYRFLMHVFIADIQETHDDYQRYATIKNAFDHLFYFLGHTEVAQFEVTKKVLKKNIANIVESEEENDDHMNKRFMRSQQSQPEMIEISETQEINVEYYPFRYAILVGLFESYKARFCSMKVLTIDDRKRIARRIKNTFQDAIGEDLMQSDEDLTDIQIIIRSLEEYIKSTFKKEPIDPELESKKQQQLIKWLNNGLKKTLALGSLAALLYYLKIYRPTQDLEDDNDILSAENNGKEEASPSIRRRKKRRSSKASNDDIKCMLMMLWVVYEFYKENEPKEPNWGHKTPQQGMRPNYHPQQHRVLHSGNFWDSDDEDSD